MEHHKPKPKVTEADARIGLRVKSVREGQKMTQADLAKTLGVTHQQVQKYERGQNRMAATRLKDIADILETPIALFLGEEVGKDDYLNSAWSNLPNNQVKEEFLQLIRSVGKLRYVS